MQKLTRQQAIQQNVNKYWREQSCERHHDNHWFYVKNGCIKCVKRQRTIVYVDINGEKKTNHLPINGEIVKETINYETNVHRKYFKIIRRK